MINAAEWTETCVLKEGRASTSEAYWPMDPGNANTTGLVFLVVKGRLLLESENEPMFM